MEWTVSRLTMLFTKGDKMSCNNYLVIPVSNILARLYGIKQAYARMVYHFKRTSRGTDRVVVVVVSQFNGTSTPKGSYSPKTGHNDCNVNSSCYSLKNALCESIRYQAKSERNVRQDLIPRVRHGEAALMHPGTGREKMSRTDCHLWLLIDYTLCKKEKNVSHAFDFSKAYNTIPKSKLLMVLKKLGCGALMPCAVAVTIMSTESMLGASIITGVVVGVKQGFPTSCTSFID